MLRTRANNPSDEERTPDARDMRVDGCRRALRRGWKYAWKVAEFLEPSLDPLPPDCEERDTHGGAIFWPRNTSLDSSIPTLV